MKKTALALAALMCLLSLLSSCAPQMKKYSYDFYDTFDTVVSVMGYAQNEQEFDGFAKAVHARMQELHKLFDIYNDYEGVVNVKTINDNAGKSPVPVDPVLLELILMSKGWYEPTFGSVNIALGPVLSIWHDYRERYIGTDEGVLPPMERLEAAAALCNPADILIDEQNGTVYLAREGMRLDVGSTGKGFATQVVARELGQGAVKNFLISSGGNVLAQGSPQDGVRDFWGVGLQNPDGNPMIPDDTPLDIFFMNDNCAVTSGDYQRYYTVDGVRYSHLIDPATLMPATHFRSVTALVPDSGDADALSTALFVLPYEQGRALIESYGYDAVWILPGGEILATDGARAMMKELGGASAKRK